MHPLAVNSDDTEIKHSLHCASDDDFLLEHHCFDVQCWCTISSEKCSPTAH